MFEEEERGAEEVDDKELEVDDLSFDEGIVEDEGSGEEVDGFDTEDDGIGVVVDDDDDVVVWVVVVVDSDLGLLFPPLFFFGGIELKFVGGLEK